ncbi:nucleoside diphosphate kinase [[Clostridium] ultunense Esp]|uniref:nucleoside-diphosphate kinase n=1 Tax=Thermicanus aegyptius TaxID=94009 RepID=UPI0002B6F56E|nr:nucleoside-diphosphate kinase [Thermicanus aegyptius]CCQ98479.1 nucleoside diphosphate kinase [[Clostridium] ultunense Esp]
MERTFVMIKPDGVQRGLIGEILSRFERKGFKLVAAKFFQVPASLAERHYGEHKEKPFFPELVRFITSSPVFAFVLEGKDVVRVVREMMGKTNPADALPGTIRGDYGLSIGMNIIHGSDSPESAAREISLWFKEEELTSYEKDLEKWI